MNKAHKIMAFVILSAFLFGIVAGCGPAAEFSEGEQEEMVAESEAVETEQQEDDIEEAEQEEAEEAEQDEAEQTYKACWIYTSVIGDQGWTYEHDQGRIMAEETIPQLETVYVENVPGGGDAERVIGQLAESGCDMILTTGSQFADAIENSAAKYPEVKFECYECNNLSENVSIFRLLWADGFYLAGMVAGGMTESDIIGWILPFPMADLLRSTNQIQRGAQAVNPEAHVQLVWTNSWYDPPKVKDAAEALMAGGADVIMHQQTSAASLIAAEANEVYAIGLTDQSMFAPEYHLCSVVANVGNIYTERIQAAIDGTWEADDIMYDSTDGTIGITPYGSKVPEELRAVVDQAIQDLQTGDLDIWTGPMYDQEGNVQVAEDHRMTIEEIQSVDWLEQGVIGSLPD